MYLTKFQIFQRTFLDFNGTVMILGLNLLYQWIEALFFSFTVLKKECIAGIENAVKHLSETGISVLFLKMRQKQKIHFKNG